MAPFEGTQEDKMYAETSQHERTLTGDEVVISGMSGLFPKSADVAEFMENLFNKVDMVELDHMNHMSHPEMTKYRGKVSGINKFDSQFFRVTHSEAVTLEPMCRKLLEQAYSAIFDAGINPLTFKGKKIGVFTGSTYVNSDKVTVFNPSKQNGFIISGGSHTMTSNCISFWLDSKAPSYNVDCSCSSVLFCLQEAYNCIKSGVCDAAIIGGAQLCYENLLPGNLRKAGFLNVGEKTRCFDKNGDVRSETISVLFLQRARDAKRVYAEVYHTLANYGLKHKAPLVQGRTPEAMKQFLEEFYSAAGVSANEVEYVEAHGTAMPESDANELEAIGQVFGKEKPVMVGCVKSNMGNSEAASGACALIKLCLAYHKGKLPANLNCDELVDVPAFKEGRAEVLKENACFERGFTAINNFSFTGNNCHVLLKGHYKPKDPNRYSCNIPRIVLIAGRQEESIVKVLDKLKNQPIDPELIGLLNNIYQVDTPGFTCRGYTILDNNEKETMCLSQSAEFYQGGTRPLWLVFSGMGSQWAGMGTELMRIPIFSAAIQKCQKALEPYGVDVLRIINEPDNAIFNNVLNCFIGIAAVQIGLIDMLKEMEIIPDNIIGHGVGEMACAYFDNGFTAEEMILAAYTRGQVTSEAELVKGSMAAIGIGYEEMKKICPSEIDISCHNSSESCTISGPADIVKTFITKLTSKGVFAKEVPCGHIPYHSRYIQSAGPEFLRRLNEVVKNNVLRSDKWISTSVPIEKWNDPVAKYSSPNYHTNNLLSPVYFEESANLIHSNAVIVEVAPHGLMQAILKRSHSECTHIPLIQRGNADPVKYFLEAVGKIYQQGYSPKVDVLYPKIQYPVSTETSLLSHYVDWYHEDDWFVTNSAQEKKIMVPSRKVIVSVFDDDFKFITGHVREGKIVFPEAAILVLLWETLAMYKEVKFTDMSVLFSDIHFHSDVIIESEEIFKLNFVINKENDHFEVTRDDVMVASGYIVAGTIPSRFESLSQMNAGSKATIQMGVDDIYNIMHLKGHSYSGEFKSISSSNHNWQNAQVNWSGNWVTFLDSLIQLNILSRNHEGLSVPKIIKNLKINITEHNINMAGSFLSGLNAKVHETIGVTRCGGVEIRNIIFDDQPKELSDPDVLQTLSFVPHAFIGHIEVDRAFLITLQIWLDNTVKENAVIVEVDVDFKPKLTQIVKSVTKNFLDTNFDIKLIESDDQYGIAAADLLIVQNLFMDLTKLEEIYQLTGKHTFILTLEDDRPLENRQFKIVSVMMIHEKYLVLLNKVQSKRNNVLFVPSTQDAKFDWLPQVQKELEKSDKLILISDRQSHCGLLGFVKKMRRENKQNLGLVVIEDYEVPESGREREIFNNRLLKDIFEQLNKNLAINILKQGKWGGYYYLPAVSSANGGKDCYLVNDFRNLDGLKWANKQSVCCDNDIEVHFAGPSLRDVKNAIGVIDGIEGFGMDYSGVDCKGNKVMGIVQCGALASSVKPNPDLFWPIPDHWTLEEAATVPLPYVHAFYCLIILGQLKPSHSVFVNGGTGALGQAVISICLSMGCKIFTCVNNAQKKRFMKKLYPRLDDKNIGYSNDDSFFNSIVSNTKGKRCDFVINCNNGASRELAMKCVGFFGFFMDISDYNLKQDTGFGIWYLEEDKTYKTVDLSNIFKTENARDRKFLQTVLSEGIANGTVRPTSYMIFAAEEVSRAFRLLSLNKHKGRVLINIRDSAKKTDANVMDRLYSSKGTYLVICDETVIGIEFVKRLLLRGVNNLILHLKTLKLSGYLRTKIMQWQTQEVNIKISTENLEQASNCSKLLKGENVNGIFFVKPNARGSTREDFVANRNEVASVVSNLDIASRKHCSDLRHFIVLSQTPQSVIDEYSTTVLEKICATRIHNKLPALLLRVKSLDNIEPQIKVESKIVSQNIETMLNAVEKSLKENLYNVLTFNVKKDKTLFLENVAKILGLKSLNEVSENLSVKDIVMNESNVEELKLIVKENNGQELTSGFIRNMTIAGLKELNDNKNRRNTQFDLGLDGFYGFMEQDENIATQIFVPMPTLLNSLSNGEYIGMDPEATLLMMVPGFEGHNRIFSTISERLKIQATAVQLGPDVTNESIEKIAAGLTQVMKKHFVIKSKFYLLGYSFGVSVALEIASILEKDGYTGVVFCLDSSPDALKVQIDAYLNDLSEAELQDSIIDHLFRIISGRKSKTIREKIEKLKTWEGKVKFCVKELKEFGRYTAQYKKDILNAAYKRIVLAKSYEPKFKLNSEVVLLKGILHPKAGELPDDYNLSKYTKYPVKVHEINSDFVSAPNDCRVANIINQSLDPDLLAEFKTQNLCDCYSNNTTSLT